METLMQNLSEMMQMFMMSMMDWLMNRKRSNMSDIDEDNHSGDT